MNRREARVPPPIHNGLLVRRDRSRTGMRRRRRRIVALRQMGTGLCKGEKKGLM